MLNGKLALHDIADVERFAAAVIRRRNLQLEWADQEDLHAYLIETAWLISRDFRPGGLTFSTYANKTLTNRIEDWNRKRTWRTKWQFANGKTYQRDPPTFLYLDAPTDTGVVADAVPVRNSLASADRAAVLEWLERTRDSERASDRRVLREVMCATAAA